MNNSSQTGSGTSGAKRGRSSVHSLVCLVLITAISGRASFIYIRKFASLSGNVASFGAITSGNFTGIPAAVVSLKNTAAGILSSVDLDG